MIDRIIVMGVDPGGRHTGIITRERDKILSACVLTRTTGDKFPDGHYINEVLDEITTHIEVVDVIALEGIVEPRGRNPEGDEVIMSAAGLIGTGIVFGAVLARWPNAVIVPPGGNGSLPDSAYPLGIRRRNRIGGPTIHARSAYDVSRVGEMLYRASRSSMRGTA